MSKKLLLSIIIVLLITNIASLLLLNKNEVVGESDGRKIKSNSAVAKINGDEISYKKWVETLRNTHGESQLKDMIDRKVVKQLAREHDIEVDEKVIEKELSLLTTMQGIMSDEKYAEAKDAWLEDIIYRYQLEQLLTMDKAIPEQKIRSYYDSYGDLYNFSSSMQISHILVKDEETANKVKQELDQGASFSLLAKEYSVDEESKDNGGYIGFINTNSQFFPDGYKEIAKEMEINTYSEPFPADNKIAIIYLHRKLPSIEFTYDEIKPYIESELALQEQKLSLSADPLWNEVEIDWIYE